MRLNFDVDIENEGGMFTIRPTWGQVAQLVEQWTENPCVAGSIPALPIFGAFRLKWVTTTDIHTRDIRMWGIPMLGIRMGMGAMRIVGG